jgi:putative ABC transport system permease protein
MRTPAIPQFPGSGYSSSTNIAFPYPHISLSQTAPRTLVPYEQLHIQSAICGIWHASDRVTMDTLRQDLSYAIRGLRKKPGFTLVASLTLALGIAANTTIFTLIDGVLLRALPFPQPGRLVSLWSSYPILRGQLDVFSPPNYLEVAARAHTLDAVGAYTDVNFALAGAGQPENIPGERFSASMSRVLGISPQLGRWFTAAEDESGEAVVLLSDYLWRNRFGADLGVLGRTLVLNGRSFVVIGVLPPHAGFPSTLSQLYIPMHFSTAENSRTNIFLPVVARMQPGVKIETLQAELRTIASSIRQAYPGFILTDMGAVPLQNTLVGNVKPVLVVLWAAVGFMLAVGCANVANLLLSQAAGRQREFALRRSLGATNARLIRQLLTESLTLAVLGGGIGLTLTAWAVPMMASRLPASFPHIRDLEVDARALWFTFVVSILTGVLFGCAVDWRGTRAAESDPAERRGSRFPDAGIDRVADFSTAAPLSGRALPTRLLPERARTGAICPWSAGRGARATVALRTGGHHGRHRICGRWTPASPG